ncbi:thioredoxin family protein [Bradyrhizobium sp. Leo121]|uniref:thioredoxin family protein n=1 Tax=Bradyrhizobium sp. Leo121 TaxID=1571195 RepID=UPI0010292ADD|nr:thioredoxin family protein [Bradyrhizobium sp. Leo121]RZN34465.1 thiol reductase thioredoxin [Bradyrhizobium sp. Leo121]
MLSRRSLVFAVVAASTAFAAPAFAVETRPFDADSFAAVQEADRPILVAIHASWCPDCQKQKPILSELTAQPEFKDLIYFTVDFDNQQDAVKFFGAGRPSTLIAFIGKTETGRLVADTERSAIAVLLAKTRPANRG